MSVQEKLRQLFLLDQQIRGLRSRVDAAARRLAAQQAKLDQYQRQQSELHDQLQHAKAVAADLASDSLASEQRIEKVRQTMTSVRSNKEYSALLVEVNTLKVEQEKIQEKELEQMTRVEELETRHQEISEKVNEQSKLVELAQNEVAEGEAEIAGQLDELVKERDDAAAPIDPDTLTLYRKLNDDYEGEALAEVEEQDRRRMEYTCGACFMSLPIQVVNATLTTSDKPVVCPSCQRILYAANELKDALIPK
ncbi:MAG: C4-type zinc ribbon domain-containing protein [Planctomycetota bacterium]